MPLEDSPSRNLRSCADKTGRQQGSLSPPVVIVSPVMKRGKCTENTMDSEMWNKNNEDIIGMPVLRFPKLTFVSG